MTSRYTMKARPCILCGGHRNIDTLTINEHGYYFAVCDREICKIHVGRIAKGQYKIRRRVHGPDYTHFEIEKPCPEFFDSHWNIQRCTSRRNPTQFRNRTEDQCEHPAFWTNVTNGTKSSRRNALVCHHHAKGDITFANYFCQVPVEYNDSEILQFKAESFIGGCANKATTTIDGLHVCKHHIPSLKEEQT